MMWQKMVKIGLMSIADQSIPATGQYGPDDGVAGSLVQFIPHFALELLRGIIIYATSNNLLRPHESLPTD